MKTAKSTKQTTYRMTCALMCALAMTTVSCSQEEPNAPEGNVKRITATAAMPEDGPMTRLAYPNRNEPQWAKNDEFGVWKENTETVSTFRRTDVNGNSALAEFKGEIACQEGDQLYAVYPKPSSVGANNQIDINFDDADFYSGQKLEPGGISNRHYMYAQAKLNNDGTIHFDFQHAVAMMEVTMSGRAILQNITLRADGLHKSGTLQITPEGFKVIRKVEGNLFVWGDLVPRKASFFLFPGALTNVKLDIRLVYETNPITFSLADKIVEAGKVYRVSVDVP